MPSDDSARRAFLKRLGTLGLIAGAAPHLLEEARAAAPLTLQPLTPKHHVWAMSEFTLSGMTATDNPYDPKSIAADVSFTGPSGHTLSRPAFWYQPFTRGLEGSGGSETETLTIQGTAGWRVRWTPLEAGPHRVQIAVTRNGQRIVTAHPALTVAGKMPGARGFAHVEPRDRRYFQTADGRPLPLLGENTCWHGRRGTYDYDDWFGGMGHARMNYSRLWMWHNAFGVEFFPEERLRYNQERAWRLDYVLGLAQRQGIYAMLCLDYHGIFEETPDMWGGNNFWPKHAYNKANGGPCATQNEFFTSPAATTLYQKRLRYLIARYSAFPSLLSWEFFNEINNVYKYLKPDDVAAWHGRMGGWLKAHDPYRHPVTTSFGSAGEQAAMWKQPALDYAQWHWYGNWGGPYQQVPDMAAGVAIRFRHDYGKPVYIGEFGTDGTGGKQDTDADPEHRGLRQALWTPLFAGAAGTSMPWWWERNHADGLYPFWTSLARFLDGTGFGAAGWQPRPVTAPSVGTELGPREPNGRPFTVTLKLGDAWGAKPSGHLALRRPGDADLVPLNGFVHGSQKPDLRTPFVIDAWLGENARLVLHLNSVANDAALAVRVNGREVFRQAYPNKDGGYDRNNEYNEDIAVPLPAGRATIEVLNPGGDWAFLDWARVENALPAHVGGTDGPPLSAWAVGDAPGRTTLVWVLDPNFSWPRGAKAPAEEVTGGFVTLHGLPDGRYEAQWWHTRDGKSLGTTQAASRTGRLKLSVVAFQTDIAARVQRQ